MANSTDSKIKTPIPPFWKEWKRLNPKYNDDITEAHKRLKEMYSYNYNSEFNDEIDLSSPLYNYRSADENWKIFEMEWEDAKS